jgi:hypothetical protein
MSGAVDSCPIHQMCHDPSVGKVIPELVLIFRMGCYQRFRGNPLACINSTQVFGQHDIHARLTEAIGRLVHLMRDFGAREAQQNVYLCCNSTSFVGNY